MINIGNSSIENVLVGDVLADRVYLGTDIVWEHSLPVVTRNYLKFTALESGTFTLTIPAAVNTSYITSISYSLDNGATWVTTLNSSSAVTITTPTINQGDSILWKGTGTALAKELATYSNFSSSGSFQASGNIMSLFYDDSFEDKVTITNNFAFTRLFYLCSGLTTAPELPATTVTVSCYQEMFRGTSIVIAPELPAMTLKQSCYQSMFSECSSLTDAPSELPATSLGNKCYQSMFYNCVSLVNVPKTLPATTQPLAAYYQMFIGCTSLEVSPELLINRIVDYGMYSMFAGCKKLNTITCLAESCADSRGLLTWVLNVSSTGTFIKSPNATFWSRGQNGIPTNWTVVDYNPS